MCLRRKIMGLHDWVAPAAWAITYGVIFLMVRMRLIRAPGSHSSTCKPDTQDMYVPIFNTCACKCKFPGFKMHVGVTADCRAPLPKHFNQPCGGSISVTCSRTCAGLSGRHHRLQGLLPAEHLRNAAVCDSGGVRGRATCVWRAAGGAAEQRQGGGRAGAGRQLCLSTAALRVLPHQRGAGAYIKTCCILALGVAQ